MQPLGKQPSYQPEEAVTEAGPQRAPASAVNAIMGRLGLSRVQDESEADEATLTHNLADPSWAVRVAAVQKLGKMGKQAPLGLLLAAIHDEQSSVRVAAARALGRNPRPAAIAALVIALKDDEWLVRAEAAMALGEMREAAPAEPLLTALRDQDAAVRAAVVKALGEIGAEDLLDPLKVALQDEDWSVREAATMALARLAERAAIPSLLDARLDRDPAVREAAETGLLEIYPEIVSSPPPPSDSFPRWLERIEFPQRSLTESTGQTVAVYGAAGTRQKGTSPGGTSRKRNSSRRRSGRPGWSHKIVHTAEGMLAAALITCLIMSWLAIETQQHSTQGQAGSPGPHTPAFTTYLQHNSDVEKLAWSMDGHTIASSDIRGTLRIWQASTGYTFEVYPQQGTILALTWSSSDTLLVACGEPNRSLQVWQFTLGPELQKQMLFQRLNLSGIPTIAAWSSDKQTLAFDAGDGAIQIWNVLADLNITTIQEKHMQYTELAWSPDDTQLATVSSTGLLETWDTYSGQHIASLASNQLASLAAWSASNPYRSGTLFVDANDTIIEWSYEHGNQKISPFLKEQTYNLANTSGLIVNFLGLSPDGSQILLATSDGLVQARDVVSGNLIYLYTGHSAQVNDIEWSPDDRHIATASMDTTVQIWQEP